MNVRRWWIGLGLSLTAGLSACSPQDGAAQTQQTQSQSTPSRSTQPRTDPESGLPFIAVAALPREGQQTLRLIDQNGPFPYSKDGASFGNREGILPRQTRNYYREYTVKTPGESDRGARRIVCGGVRTLTECYYTADHYAFFQRIRP
ncbi:ribonuclease [Deinococcus sp. QL22]|uniref:ribonuclease n=1 Tax=Deinococcus sp. QL22 TaxID=2939437 RepID=UPI00201835BD|nr:ribonuclease [Deinococcus sp. QL22]UQN06813.1 ribonuclease [Deinococcus sp. QL22]